MIRGRNCVNIIPIRREFEWAALEFFAGIGLARAGMGLAGIKTVWANDYDLNKKAMYEGHWVHQTRNYASRKFRRFQHSTPLMCFDNLQRPVFKNVLIDLFGVRKP